MPKYRKKPIVIEAFQYNIEPYPQWMIEEIYKNNVVEFKIHDSRRIKIKTLEGVMEAGVGDYVIKGIKGEIYPCKPEIFRASYEEVIDETGGL